MKTEYIPNFKYWSAIELFSQVKAEDVLIDQVNKWQYFDFFKYDLQSEYDAKHLYNKLVTDCHPSKEFRLFLDIWVNEELNHSKGFSRILNLLFNENEAQLMNKLKEGTPDFSQLGNFLDDEFKLCVLFAYDELFSVMSYKQDLFYKTLGPRQFSAWLRLIIIDEARHYMNLIKLIGCKYRHRLPEISKILDDIINIESQNETYKYVFLLDHELFEHERKGNSISKKTFETYCINRVLLSLSRFQ